MKVALTFCILSLVFLAIFSSESGGKKESLQNVHNKRALSHKADSGKAVNKRKLKKPLNKRFNKRRNSRRGKKLRNKGKESRQSSNCDKDQAFKDYKKAVEYKKKIDRVVKFVKQLEKKSTNLNPFKNFTALFGAATDNGTTCTQEAKEAYQLLQSCSDTIPTLCSPPDISIKEAEDCTNDTTSSFAKFAKCATKKSPGLCGCYTDFDKQFPDICGAFVDKTSEVTESRKLCMNSNASGSFSNCMQFVKTEGPIILEKCISSGEKVRIIIVKPRPQSPKSQTQKPKTKGPWADTKISWATTPHITFKHEGRVPQ